MDAAPLCSLATVSSGGRSHINHMYFAWSDRFDIFWISDPDSIHSRNLVRNSSAAITIYDSHQTWGRPDRGTQLFGTAGITKNRDARRIYGARFRDYDAESDDLPTYRFRARRVKLFDERLLAPGTLVFARVNGDSLKWVRTEVWT